MENERADGEVLRATGVSYVYGSRQALVSVSLTVKLGELVAVVGRNGAGKSTLLRCLAGWSRMAEGEVTILGMSLRSAERELRRHLVLVPDVPHFYDELTAWEHLQLVGQIHGVEDWAARAERSLRRFGLWASRHAFPAELSRGMRYKLALCVALAIKPEVMLLDEPFGPLDPVSAQFLWEELRLLCRDGMAILLSTHQLPPGVEPDRYVMMEQGEVLAVGTPADLRGDYALAADASFSHVLRAAIEEWESEQDD
ncbi:MAG: ABC transporter ATP-binding protein [Chloroflexota bacterium]